MPLISTEYPPGANLADPSPAMELKALENG
jgi:hypothetical protein